MKHLFTLALLAVPLLILAQPATFTPPELVATGANAGSRPNGLAVADVNADGHLDVLVTNNGPSTLGVLLGNGRGSFTLQPNAPSTGTNANPLGVVVADLNGDGKLDAAVTNYAASSLAVLLGDGQGGFTLQPNSPGTGGGQPASPAQADVNGDGHVDVLVANLSSGTLGVLLGDGKGNLVLQPNSPSTVGRPYAVVVADVNGDGKPDALVVNAGSNTLGVLLGDGKGGFALQPNSPGPGSGTGPGSLAIADVSGDGKLDVVVGNINTNTLGILLGDGKGGFVLQPNSPATGGSNGGTYGVALADVNGDGQADALVANTNNNALGVLLGDGQGHFVLQASPLSTGLNSGPFSVAAVDVNSDGRPDALTADIDNGTLGIFLNTTGLLPTRASLPGTAVHLYPNPAHTSAQLTLTGLPPAATQVQATLLDVLGRTVAHHTLPATGGQFPLAVPTGLYVVRLTAQDAQGQALGELPAQRVSVE